MRNPPRAVKCVRSELDQTRKVIGRTDLLTGVDGGYCAFNNDRWEAIETGKGGYDLLESGELSDHIEKQSNKS